jgi:uncharacterized membrane protein (UPF0182 family)
MKKTATNFSMDILLFIVLLSQSFTGIILHRVPSELSDNTVLGLTRYTWGTLHWVVSLLFVVVILAHIILHWSWMKSTTKKFFKIPSFAFTILLFAIVIVALLTPFCITNDFPDRDNGKAAYSTADLQETAINLEEVSLGPASTSSYFEEDVR